MDMDVLLVRWTIEVAGRITKQKQRSFILDLIFMRCSFVWQQVFQVDSFVKNVLYSHSLNIKSTSLGVLSGWSYQKPFC